MGRGGPFIVREKKKDFRFWRDVVMDYLERKAPAEGATIGKIMYANIYTLIGTGMTDKYLD